MLTVYLRWPVHWTIDAIRAARCWRMNLAADSDASGSLVAEDGAEIGVVDVGEIFGVEFAAGGVVAG